MPAKKTTRRTGGGTTRQRAETPRTIEQIEARADEVLRQEQAAISALVACVREIAVRLPLDSRLPLDLVAAARLLELFGSGKHVGTAVVLGLGGGSRAHPETLTQAIDTYMPRAGQEDES